MYDEIVKKESSIALIGLGYVGLPIALAFAKKVKVVGFDINHDRVLMMREGIDPSNELDSNEFEGCDIEFTSDIEDLRKASFYIVAVPTPITKDNLPDLKPLISASTTVGKVLKKGDYVVFESTVYPGCTEEECIPILEKESGLKFKEDFKVGYSPERINPGDKEHTITKILKVVSGCDDESLEEISKVYEIIIEPGTYKAASIKVAEAAKIIENTQRDLNIALMNELSLIFEKMDINTYDVLEAASTKWNFLKFYPGLVGGHCIGVDPYYLTYKAKQLGIEPHVIDSGRFINDSMAKHIADRCIQHLNDSGTELKNSKVLVMGVTFKEDVSDIRNSKVADIVNELKSVGVHVDAVDPHADHDELIHEYGFGLNKIGANYDSIIVAVNHREYKELDEKYFKSLLNEKGLLIDIKGIYNKKFNALNYWSL